jgi:excisionase family DNA binding protein
VLKVKAVAQRLALSISAVYALLESGRLPHYKIGGAIRVSEDQLKEYLDSCRRGRNSADGSEASQPLRAKLTHISLTAAPHPRAVSD